MEEQPASHIEAELDLTSLDETRLPEGHRSGFVAVVGHPNVGKSTLMNALLGQKIAIVSTKPQTTRLQQLGILTTSDYQVIFMDTPGFHLPRQKLGEFMMETVTRSLTDADLILFLVDGAASPTDEDNLLAERIKNAAARIPVIVVLNKIDLIDPEAVQEREREFSSLVPACQSISISAQQKKNLANLLDMIVAILPKGPRFYPADQITDTRVRDLAGEIIREQALDLLQQEVPHGIAVQVHEFKERENGLFYIKATILVEREAHKGIVIGNQGRMLKQIGTTSRTEIERVLGVGVYLDLWVKVRPRWRNDDKELRRLGYYHKKD